MTYTAHKADRVFSTSVEDFPRPHGKLEDWRFTPTRRFTPLAQVPEESARRAWTIDLSTPGGAQLTRLARTDSPTGQVELPSDRLAAVAWNSSKDVDVLRFPADATAAEPTVLTIDTAAEAHPPAGASAGDTSTPATVTCGHLVVEVPANTSAKLLVYRSGEGLQADNIEFSVGDNATLTVAFVNLWDDDAVVASAHHAHVGRDARLHHGIITLGGGATRTTTSVKYGGPGGDVDLLGLFFGGAGQHVENRLLIDHQFAHCRSNVNYKGALLGSPNSKLGDAHGVWVGDVLIRPEAHGTDTYESNRNLLLSKASRVDSIPNLEIATGQIIGAGHASTTGRFDEEQLFYLQSRGIDEVTARQLVVRGFFHDIVHKLNLPSLEDELDAVVIRQLERAGL